MPMKLKLKPVVVSLSLLLAPYASEVFAEATPAPTQADLSNQVQQLTEQTVQLQQQLAALQQQMAAMQSSQATAKEAAPAATGQLTSTAPASSSTTTTAQTPKSSTTKSNTAATPAASTSTSANATTTEKKPTFKELAEEHPSLPYEGKLNLSRLGGTAVISSPFIESNSDFAGSDLIVNYSSIKKDVAVLDQRQNFENMMNSIGIDAPKDSLIELSGMLAFQGYGNRDFSGDKTSDVNLTAAELDFQAHINPIVTGFMSLTYDDSPPAFGARVDNSNIALDNGFITFGNFNKSPFYATGGQMYVPFGYFSTYLISDPFNKSMFRTKARPVEVGYQQSPDSGAYASVYGFKGDSRTGTFDPTDDTRSPSDTINTAGADAGYRFHPGPFKVNIGGSYISNSTDAAGMQSTSGPDGTFQGFGTNSSSEVLQHRVPAADLRGSVNYNPLTVWAEYTTNTQDFNQVDMTFNGHGAQPSGLHVESDYKFGIFDRASTFVLAYDQSDEALALNVPRRGYSTALSSAIWEHTLEIIELHHYVNYDSGDTATGDYGPTFTAEGKISNAVIGEVDVYF